MAMADVDPLDPVAADGSPANAFATHKARADGIARFFALTRRLKDIKAEQAGEDNTTTLIAHCHMLALDPGFTPPGEEPSATAMPAALRRLNRGNGLVGTKGASTERDYDMAVKGLMVLLYRYSAQLGPDLVKFIMDDLLPDYLVGGHPPEIEVVEFSFLNIDGSETENHLLMIESSRYLINQLRFDETPDPKFDNRGLKTYLLDSMQRFLRHDFLEFNSRPYQRLALHPMLNLHEFARDPVVRDAARMVLDYVMTKFALSSNRGRRVTPFRRQQHRINHQANLRNNLYSDQADQVAGFFLACTGLLDAAGKPTRFPDTQSFTGLLGALAAYRPPPAVYTLALRQDNPPSLHRFYHGNRPRLTASPADAEGGLEIYHHSPSFLISAGGSFLNSGYGHDEVDLFKQAWEQTSRAQATTVIPTRAETEFHDLLRFEAYPDPRIDPYNDDPEDPDAFHTQSVNYGVVPGFAAGANMRPAERKTVEEQSTSATPSLAPHRDQLCIAWKGSGNDNLNIGKVQATTVMGIDGVEGIEQAWVLAETSDTSPAIVSNGGRLYLAWKGSGNDSLNIAFCDDWWPADVASRQFPLPPTWKGKTTLNEKSEYAPALASHDGRLYLAWVGLDEHLNVARVTLIGNTAGAFTMALENKVTLGETSEAAPALASHGGRLFLAWKGSGNDAVSLAFSADGVGFTTKTFNETSSHGPSLAAHGGRLFFSWKGSGNENLNIAQVVLIGNTAGGFGVEGLESKVVLSDISEQPPAIGSGNGLLCVAWKGEADDNIDLAISRDGRFSPVGPWIFADRSPLGFYLAAYRTAPAHPDQLIEPLDSLGFAYLMEIGAAAGLGFEQFKERVKAGNTHLPAQLEYGGRYVFNAPDGRKIAMWLELTQMKYTPRVVDLAEPIEDFTTLPLVSGRFMRAPGGHDGLIEIWHPGCEQTAVTLDFRTAASPSRKENRTGCPGPWLDRVSAMFALSRQFDALGRAHDANVARADAAVLYDEMLRIDTDRFGPPLAPAVIEALAVMGVDFSVPEQDLRGWLANPEFTPYPAIAQALLGLGRKLKAPVFIDVISFNYENRPGVASPRVVGDVRGDVLRVAIVEGWNVRYGASIPITGFEQLLVP
ncbi:hypothetical protein [Streptomyces sp. NPDC000618]|uniref:hypothetical protein n=1 Tax=Streptomyces sp. NPDC000618 TaxID=3154265 RepID=UPI003333281D